MNWKEGDIAICIKVGALGKSSPNANSPALRLNAEYVVQNINQCPKCKHVALDVGLGTSDPRGTECFCGELVPCKDIHWCASERFVKKQTLSLKEQIAEAIAVEDYELANKLKLTEHELEKAS